ncbi:RluA family pseudouridine synthase [Ureaplasma zalophigenitalium]|uniref:Pseudouridine synthase n=1 Tax=Ureaplasma zalophigenitalium TaxID=907723 RepID=A0ABT3BPJ7_9BACT|nr:RluA family pseudouridine synthase [Ureaplasma zalophigenitalium]MCV3754165.1 RluA family pseudouridine synthase [Ureaplasma zalophigenitalium]
MKSNEIVVKDLITPIRVDKFLASQTDYSRTQIKAMIEANLVTINDEPVKAKTIVDNQDIIAFQELSILVKNKTKADYIYPLEIVYEDEYLLAINKPSGMLVHPSQFNEQDTLINAVQYYLQTSNFYLVHRIDKHTSGLVLFAKDQATYTKMQTLFMNRAVIKKYYALVANRFDDQHLHFQINEPIGYSYDDSLRMQTGHAKNKKDAVSVFKVVEQYRNSALIEVQIITGRKHQIRVHCLYMNHPVLNDPLYSNRKKVSSYEQYLHAYFLEFTHPIRNTLLSLQTTLPREFNTKIDELKEHLYEEC